VSATDSDVSEGIVEMIAAGDAIALRPGLLVFRCWDAGLLSDFFKAAGQFFERQPNAFLALLDGYLISRTDLSSLVTTLPERDVDDLEAQIATMRTRHTALGSNPQLSWLASELESEALRLESLREPPR